MIYRGKVTALATTGVYVTVTDLHPTQAFGPLRYAGAKPAVDDMVLVAVVGSDETVPDMVVIASTGSLAVRERIDVTNAGDAYVVIAPDTSSSNGYLGFNSDGKSRFYWTLTSANGGALQLRAFNDAATSWVAPIAVTRSDSAVTFGGNVLINGNAETVNASGASYVFVRGQRGAPAAVFLYGGASATDKRWLIGRDSSGESGTNVGSDFIIERYNDAGDTALSSPVKITRSSGKVTLADVGTSAGIEMGASGPTIQSGSGAPTHSAPNGSLWLRTNGSTGTTLYVRENGAWVAK